MQNILQLFFVQARQLYEQRIVEKPQIQIHHMLPSSIIMKGIKNLKWGNHVSFGKSAIFHLTLLII